jgi:hypothetical protein
MYTIIGADQREYGPVSAEQVRQWLAEGRANGQTSIRAEGETAWTPLGTRPEFADLVAAQVARVTPPPRIADSEAARLAQAMAAADYRLDIGNCFSRGWALVRDNFWLLTGATAVVVFLALGLGSIPALGTVASLVLTFPLWGGLDWLFLKRIRGEPADMSDAFAGFTLAFAPLVWASIVIQLLTFVGLVLCVLPGIYLFVAWWGFTALIILDKKLDFWPAMELSRQVVNRHWWTVFALVLLVLLVGSAGVLLLGVGVFLTLPLAVAASVYAYEDIFNRPLPAPASGTLGPAPVTPAEPAPAETAPAVTAPAAATDEAWATATEPAPAATAPADAPPPAPAPDQAPDDQRGA